MPDMYIEVILAEDNFGNIGKAVAELRYHDPEFLWPASPWWRKPPDDARGRVARVLSKHGCKGKLSVEPHVEGTAWDQAPPPRWTGFTPKKRK